MHYFKKRLGKHDIPMDDMISNIERVLKFALDGNDITTDRIKSHDAYNWYRVAREECQAMANEFKRPLNQVVGIVAALSPGVEWTRNVVDARLILEHGENAIVTSYGHNKVKAVRIYNGENSTSVLMPLRGQSGFKVFSFYVNILFPDYCHAVTIDRHAHRIAMFQFNGYEPKIDRSRYAWISDAYVYVAKRYNVLPNRIQSITWETAKMWKIQGVPSNV